MSKMFCKVYARESIEIYRYGKMNVCIQMYEECSFHQCSCFSFRELQLDIEHILCNVYSRD